METLIREVFGVIPSPTDPRDIPMSAIMPGFSVPPAFECMNITPPRHQGGEGTCVGFALASVKESQEMTKNNRSVLLSPRYIYEKSKLNDGIPPTQRCTGKEGTYIRTALNVLINQGVCEEIYWPYNACQPGQADSRADQNAAEYKISTYADLGRSIDLMKQSLVINGPFIMGVKIYQNWFTPQVMDTGIIPMQEGQGVAEHAICIVGYEDRSGYFRFKNSLGPEWGNNGFGFLPYQYVMDTNYFEAYGLTELLADPQPIVGAREEVMKKLELFRESDMK